MVRDILVLKIKTKYGRHKKGGRVTRTNEVRKWNEGPVNRSRGIEILIVESFPKIQFRSFLLTSRNSPKEKCWVSLDKCVKYGVV
jgi:hypothetical protein